MGRAELLFLLIELTREANDCTTLQPRLEPLSRCPFPASSPEERASKRRLRAVTSDEPDCGDLDEADEGHAQLLQEIWMLCDGRTTLDRLLLQRLHGRARTLRAALDALERQGCIEQRPLTPSSDARNAGPRRVL